jgi:hypothetical protein
LLGPDLQGALEVDFEEDVETLRWIGPRGPVEIAEELGPFEETTGVDLLLEGRTVDKAVGIFWLSGPTRPGGP